VLAYRLGGQALAVAAVGRHAGRAHDPAYVARFQVLADRLLPGLAEQSTWQAVLAAEPGPQPRLNDDQLDAALPALADFADLKSAWFTGHSRAVAALAATAAIGYGLPAEDCRLVRRAGWVHDLGQVGISSGLWERAAPLTAEEWEAVRLHPYYVERVLGRSVGLAGLGRLAGLHHERLDGGGYHRGLQAGQLPLTARLLAAAEVYQALIEARPHRSALTAEQAAVTLQAQVRGGQLDSEAVAAVLKAAGHRAAGRRRSRLAGLSQREIDVLRLLARGHSNRQIADRLAISERTVHHHVEHIYDKLNVSTRAAATLIAMQQHLLADDDRPLDER
jgi:HD-GYP domain-containing protein (c-di-GMP phosphodiesterase class II)